MRLWRNWYTRSVEVAVGFILWKFKSSRPHQLIMKKIIDNLKKKEEFSAEKSLLFINNHGNIRNLKKEDKEFLEDMTSKSIPFSGCILPK